MDPHQSPLNYCQDVVRIGGTKVLLGEAIASTKQSFVVISEINQCSACKRRHLLFAARQYDTE